MKNQKTKKIIKYLFSPVVFFFVFLLPFSLYAQGPTALSPTEAFKWYEFGKLNISISSSLPSNDLAAGSVLPLKFDIKNETKFPITEGTLYIKIYRERGTDTKKDYFKEVATKEELNQGVALVDQFFMAENLAIDKGGQIRLNHDYTIPKDAQGGRYKLVAYFQSIRKMNLQGLSFTDDVPGSVFYYQVENSNQKGAVEFDRGSVTVNGELYDFNSMLKVYEAEKEVKISAQITNTTNSSQKVSISKAYNSWDGLDEKNNFGNNKEDLNLSPGENKNLEFIVPQNTHPVTYVTIDARWGENSHSLINVRFARDVEAEARVNSIGITDFPLENGEKTNIFITAHEVRQMVDFDSILDENGELNQSENEQNQNKYRIDATLKDENQEILGSYFFEGRLTEDVTGFDGIFDSRERHNYLTLEAKLTNLKTKKVIDTTTITYYCQNKNFAGCPADSAFTKQGSISITKDKSDEKSGTTSFFSKALITVIFLILLLSLSIYLRSKKIVSFLFFLLAALIISGVFGFSSVQAESLNYTPSSLPPKLSFKCPLAVKTNGYNYFWKNLSSFSWNITYSAVATRDLAGTIPLPSGSTLSPGETFYVTDTTHSNANAIYYNATGSYADTPYGYFNAGAARNASRWDSIYSYGSGGYYENLATSFSFNSYAVPDQAGYSKMTVGSATNTFNYNSCTGSSVGGSSVIQDATAPITCSYSGTPYVWSCVVSPATTSFSGSVKMVYGCTYGAFYYKAWREGQTRSTPGSCTTTTQTCNFYQGQLSTKLSPSSDDNDSFFSSPYTPGACTDIAGGSYTYPGPDGCWSTCLHTGPSLCGGGNSNYRPIVSQQEIPFTFNIAQVGYTVDLSASPSSGDEPLNGVQLQATLTAEAGKSMPSGNVNLSFNCGNGTTYNYNNIVAGTNSPVSYSLQGTDRCNYNASGTYSASVTVTKGGITKFDSFNIDVTEPSDVKCGIAVNLKYCNETELVSNLCENGSLDSPPGVTYDGATNSFVWTCGGGSASCFARKKCVNTGSWKEIQS